MKRICYLGDDKLTGAAAYLAGVMAHYGLPFDHVGSAERPPDDLFEKAYALYVLSDYPARNFTREEMIRLAERVRGGAGLLMIGGWESFHGAAGGYERSPLAEALPVVMASGDDRVNCPQPCLVNKVRDHEILQGLPFDDPPGIGGFNRVTARTDRTGVATLLTAVRYRVQGTDGEFCFSRIDETPLLVVGDYGAGRTAAFTTDVAPHWVGGLVDWGDDRVVQPVGGATIEVGNCYAQFLHNLLRWTGRL